jgi:hypothetical protein
MDGGCLRVLRYCVRVLLVQSLQGRVQEGPGHRDMYARY